MGPGLEIDRSELGVSLENVNSYGEIMVSVVSTAATAPRRIVKRSIVFADRLAAHRAKARSGEREKGRQGDEGIKRMPAGRETKRLQRASPSRRRTFDSGERAARAVRSIV